MFFQFDLESSSEAICIPRYLSGPINRCMPKVWPAISFQGPNHMITDLANFTSLPDAFWKQARILESLSCLRVYHSQISKCHLRTHFLRVVCPYMEFLSQFNLDLGLEGKPFLPRRLCIWEETKDHPVFPPFLTSNTGDRSQFTNTLPFCAYIKVTTRLVKFGEKYTVSKPWSKHSWEM